MKYSVSQYVDVRKGKLELKLLECYEKPSKHFQGCDLWSCGCFVSTNGLAEQQLHKHEKWQEKNDKHDEQVPQNIK